MAASARRPIQKRTLLRIGKVCPYGYLDLVERVVLIRSVGRRAVVRVCWWVWMVVRFVCVIRVPVCARVPRVCPGSPRCLFPFPVLSFQKAACLFWINQSGPLALSLFSEKSFANNPLSRKPHECQKPRIRPRIHAASSVFGGRYGSTTAHPWDTRGGVDATPAGKANVASPQTLIQHACGSGQAIDCFAQKDPLIIG